MQAKPRILSPATSQGAECVRETLSSPLTLCPLLAVCVVVRSVFPFGMPPLFLSVLCFFLVSESNMSLLAAGSQHHPGLNFVCYLRMLLCLYLVIWIRMKPYNFEMNKFLFNGFTE